MQEYLAAWGHPLVSTSLNNSGEAPATEVSTIPADVVALTLPRPLSGIPEPNLRLRGEAMGEVTLAYDLEQIVW